MNTKVSGFRTLGLLFLLTAFMHVQAFAQNIEGDWYGKVEIEGITLRITVHVSASGESYTSTWDSPDQNAFGIPATTTSFKFPEFAFSYDPANLKYSGEVNAGYTGIYGFMVQNGRRMELNFGRTVIAPAQNSPSAIKQKYDKKEVYITMRDGIRLFTSIYTPKDTSVPHPMLLNRTPYDIEPQGPENFNFFIQVYDRYIKDDYIMVFQDVRGKYMSEGTFEDIRPVIPVKKSNNNTDETTDTWDTVDWLVKNVSNNNGRVGIFGISYPGFYSTMGLINAHPAVKAVSPQAPVTAWFLGDDFHHNGAFFLMDCFSFFYSNGRPHRAPTRKSEPRFIMPVADSYEFFLSLGADRNIAPKYFDDTIKFWNEAFAHPNYDSFWKARDPRQFLKNVTPAVMTVGGWFDAEDLYGTIHTYEAIEKQNPPTLRNYLVMGPWSHGQWAFGEGTHLGNIYWGQDANKHYIEQEENFFNYFLKDQGTLDMPEATIFVTGTNEWRNFETWPPTNVSEQSIYLQEGEKASFDKPAQNVSFDEYVTDPEHPVSYIDGIHTERTTEYMTDDQRFALRRPDVMGYQTGILDRDMTLTGPVIADLFVSTTGTDADYIVKLIDVFPDDAKAPDSLDVKVPWSGYQMLVRAEVFRGKFRNSFEKPEPFKPGVITEVKYTMPDVAHTFRKGHRIMIQVQNSWFPLVDRNPQKFVDIYTCSDADFQKATQRIYHDSAHPSHLVVNVLK
ncbi:MAG: CocE/NonD family hydrolase [Bacteroidales bacterium]